jgi:hypothetical protein
MFSTFCKAAEKILSCDPLFQDSYGQRTVHGGKNRLPAASGKFMKWLSERLTTGAEFPVNTDKKGVVFGA